MNYYVITEEIFNTLAKDNISFCLKSIDNTKRLISTTDTVNENVKSFENISICSQYTFDNSSDWVGDGTGVTVEEIESTPYIFNLDP
jgi:hypothetical protein